MVPFANLLYLLTVCGWIGLYECCVAVYVTVCVGVCVYGFACV